MVKNIMLIYTHCVRAHVFLDRHSYKTNMDINKDKIKSIDYPKLI